MVIVRFAFVVFLFLVISCSTSTEKKLNFAVVEKKVSVQSSGCGSDSLACATFEVTYPYFSSFSDSFNITLMDYLTNAVAYDNPESNGFTLQQMGEQFTTDFDLFQKEYGKSPMDWYFQSSVTTLLTSDTLMSFAVNTEYFTGGAHGGYSTYYVNIHPVTRKRVVLSDVLGPNYETALQAAGEKAFREIRAINTEESLAENGFEFRDGIFHLNDNYGFTPDGVVFFFNNYEIAPYALGPTEILIPYVELKRLR